MRQRRTIRNGNYGGGGIVTMNGGGEISYWGESGGGGVTVEKNRGRPELVISVGLKNLNIIRTKNYLS
jgi:hypothetical protein